MSFSLEPIHCGIQFLSELLWHDNDREHRSELLAQFSSLQTSRTERFLASWKAERVDPAAGHRASTARLASARGRHSGCRTRTCCAIGPRSGGDRIFIAPVPVTLGDKDIVIILPQAVSFAIRTDDLPALTGLYSRGTRATVAELTEAVSSGSYTLCSWLRAVPERVDMAMSLSTPNAAPSTTPTSSRRSTPRPTMSTERARPALVRTSSLAEAAVRRAHAEDDPRFLTLFEKEICSDGDRLLDFALSLGVAVREPLPTAAAWIAARSFRGTAASAPRLANNLQYCGCPYCRESNCSTLNCRGTRL